MVAATDTGVLRRIDFRTELEGRAMPYTSRLAAIGDHCAGGPKLGALRLSTRVAGRAALAWNSGELVVLQANKVLHERVVKHDGKAELIADVQWDPLSDVYLLVGCISGFILLLDVETNVCLSLSCTDSPPGIAVLVPPVSACTWPRSQAS